MRTFRLTLTKIPFLFLIISFSPALSLGFSISFCSTKLFRVAAFIPFSNVRHFSPLTLMTLFNNTHCDCILLFHFRLFFHLITVETAVQRHNIQTKFIGSCARLVDLLATDFYLLAFIQRFVCVSVFFCSRCGFLDAFLCCFFFRSF